jgi:hypothetical protein
MLHKLTGARRRASLDKQEPEQLLCPNCKKPFSSERGLKIHLVRYCSDNAQDNAQPDT